MDVMTYGLLNSKANLNNPHFNGAPTAPNPKTINNSQRIATTNFVHNVIEQDLMDSRNFGYNIKPNDSITLSFTQCFIVIGRETTSASGVACLVDQWGGITYFNRNDNLATIEINNNELTITNNSEQNITAVCFLYSVYFPFKKDE